MTQREITASLPRAQLAPKSAPLTLPTPELTPEQISRLAAATRDAVQTALPDSLATALMVQRDELRETAETIAAPLTAAMERTTRVLRDVVTETRAMSQLSGQISAAAKDAGRACEQLEKTATDTGRWRRSIWAGMALGTTIGMAANLLLLRALLWSPTVTQAIAEALR